MAYQGSRVRGGLRELAIAVVIPLVTGGLSALLTMGAMQQFSQLNQPLLAPPGWVFPVVWTILYVLMGLSSFLVWRRRERDRGLRNTQWRALVLYVIQLFFNFCWSLLFFRGGWYYVSFVWLLALWILVAALVVHANRLDGLAAGLLAPYLLWITFAGYLNLGVALLN